MWKKLWLKLPTLLPPSIFIACQGWNFFDMMPFVGSPSLSYETLEQCIVNDSFSIQPRQANSMKYASQNLIPIYMRQKGLAFHPYVDSPFHLQIPPPFHSPSIYIPPHHREPLTYQPYSIRPEDIHHAPIDHEGMLLIINNQDSEECWKECQHVDLFTFWNGPKVDMHNFTDQVGE